MKRSEFGEWTLDKLDSTFGLTQVRTSETLDAWLASAYQPNEIEKSVLLTLQHSLRLGVDNWNEVELGNKFISPLMMAVNFDNERFAYFLQRELQSVIQEYDLYGKVDGMIASGFRNPHHPYFCLSEYKKQFEQKGDPAAQTLVAMLVAQTLNQNQDPMYGCYIVGRDWFFMVLEEKKYCISNDFSATKAEIFDIFRILQGLKQVVLERIQESGA